MKLLKQEQNLLYYVSEHNNPIIREQNIYNKLKLQGDFMAIRL